MTKNQSRQDPLNYGIRINNRLAFLMADSQRGDFPPTDQSIEFFKVIKEELNHELASLNKLLNTYVSQEPLIIFIRDDVVKPNIGKNFKP